MLQKLDELVILTGRVWADPKKVSARAPKPYRYPRPAERTKKKRKGSTPEEIRRFFRGK